MAKRKKKKKNSPDLPSATLERARRQVAGEDVDAELLEQQDAEAPAPEKTAEAPPQPEKPAPKAAATARNEPPPARRRSSGTNRAQVNNRQRKDAPLDNVALENMLANPTKVVTEDSLKAEYGYVIMDIRNMGMLAAMLFVVLIIVAQFL